MSVAGSPLLRLFVSYDIACQWHENLWERMKLFEFDIQFKEGENTSVSGPGARRDQLDIHFQDSNWKKIVQLGRDLFPSSTFPRSGCLVGMILVAFVLPIDYK
ncbi:hypothetical protein B0H13DRAFT_2338683 [Mycena leptocephala]|nr:hypothetical protein B0H13DRAFT_2338683 [Mycena leptocephala]